MLPRRSREKASSTTVARPSNKPVELPVLQLSRNGTLLQKTAFDVPRILIGRSEENHFAIPSDYVSRYHILLIRHCDSTILIDLNSTNGTFVNSKRVYSHVLNDGDVITVDLHSMFVQYSVEYSDPTCQAKKTLDDLEAAEEAIAKARSELAALLGKDDTDFLPALSENLPTEIGFIDDR